MKQKTLTVPFILLSLLMACSSLLAESPADSPICSKANPGAHVTAPESEAPEPAVTNALRVVIDAQTGRLRAPTPEEAAALATGKVAARNIESMPVEKAVDGTLTVRLGAAFLKAATAHRESTGELEIAHDAVAAVSATEIVENTETEEDQ